MLAAQKRFEFKSGKRCYLECGGRFNFVFTKFGYSFIRCNHCGLVTQENNFDYHEFIKKYYTQDYFLNANQIHGYFNYLSEESLLRRNFRNYIKFFKRFKSNGDLLDIGCGAGFMIDESIKDGYDAWGIDVSEYIINKSSSEIYKRISAESIESYQTTRLFEVITLFDVIEHLADPFGSIKKINTLLYREGIVVLVSGDTGSSYSKILKSHNHFYAPPHHLFNFNRRNITLMLEKSGFKVLNIDSIGKWISYPYLSRLAYHLDITIINNLLNSRFNKYLNNLNFYFKLGDSMIVVAKKC